jgi:hypothetical protein
VQVVGLNGVTAVAAGAYHALVAKGDGSVWCWGYNGQAQLGNGGGSNSSLPVQAGGLTGVTAVGAGYYHSLARKGDGTVWGWGDNEYGQLGDGTNTAVRFVPVQATGLNGVTAMGGGYFFSVASKTDGSVWAWGDGRYGQVGIEPAVTPRQALINLTQGPPQAPQLSYATNGLDLTINWTPVPGATGYTLYYAPYPYTGEASIASMGMGSNTAFNITLWEGAAYYIAVTARNSYGASGYSNIGQFTINTHMPPDAPQLSYAVNGTSITINWASVPTSTGYRLNYMPSAYTEPTDFATLDLAGQTSFSYDHLQPGGTYTIAVQAYNAYGTSGYSNIESFTVP